MFVSKHLTVKTLNANHGDSFVGVASLTLYVPAIAVDRLGTSDYHVLNFKVDHPFAFCIRHANGNVLFTGRYLNVE